jgi:hypothetical protein
LIYIMSNNFQAFQLVAKKIHPLFTDGSAIKNLEELFSYHFKFNFGFVAVTKIYFCFESA